jgi:hypothetical protein
MPKKSTPYCLIITYSKRVALILVTGLVIVVPCSCYKKLGLECIVELTTRYYAFYIRAKARCSLVFSNTKRNKISAA